eukprot:SAG31_NODE_3353_length_4370_cov_1.783423_5_plen_113_part_00
MLATTGAVLAYVVLAKPYKGNDDDNYSLLDEHRLHVVALSATILALLLGLFSLAVGNEDSDGRSLADAMISFLISLVAILPMVYTRVRSYKEKKRSTTSGDGNKVDNPMDTE